MDHDLIIRYVSTLGFPTCAAIAMGWAMWKLGSRLVDAHTQTLAAGLTELKKQTFELSEIKEALPAHCRATCPLVPGAAFTVSPEGH